MEVTCISKRNSVREYYKKAPVQKYCAICNRAVCECMARFIKFPDWMVPRVQLYQRPLTSRADDRPTWPRGGTINTGIEGPRHKIFDFHNTISTLTLSDKRLLNYK